MRTLGTTSAALAILAAACGGAGTPTGSPTTAGGPSSTGGRQPTSLPGGELAPCQNPEGFTVSAPVAWATNRGQVVPACSYFDPDPFEVPDATDQRPAAISFNIDAVPFDRAAAAVDDPGADRAETVLDGRRAVRLSYEASGDGLRRAGTPVTSYLVDLGERDGRPATLIASTIGTGTFDYPRNVIVLDRMARTITFDGPPPANGESVVALAGRAGATVAARADSDRVCLQAGSGGEAVCTQRPAADQVHTMLLRDGLGRDGTAPRGRSLSAGVTGADVWRVDLETPEGETVSRLTVPVAGTSVGAYAFGDDLDGFRLLVLRDVTGATLRTVEPGAA